MNKVQEVKENAEATKTPRVNFYGDVSRRVGNVRTVTLNNRPINIDHILGTQERDHVEFDSKR